MYFILIYLSIFILLAYFYPVAIFFISVFILIHLWIFTLKNRILISVLLLSFYLKILLIFYHISVNPLFGSGNDATTFHILSSVVASDLKNGIVSFSFSGWRLYVEFIGILYYLIGTHEVIPLLMNVVFSLFSIYLIYKITHLLSGEIKISIVTATIVSFFPNFILISVLNLRESLIIFLAAWSFYLFLLWLKTYKTNVFVKSLICIILSGALHGGMIFITCVYLFIYCVYSPRTNKIKLIGAKSIIGIVLGLSSIWVYLNFLNNKMKTLDQVVQSASSVSDSRAAYLHGMSPDSILEIIIYTPIRIAYFLFTPFPWQISSVVDLLGLVDVGLYWMLIFFGIKGLKEIKKNNKLAFYSVILILVAELFVFSWGTSNYGTAIRHRLKFIWLIAPIVMIGFLKSSLKILLLQIFNPRKMSTLNKR